MPKKKKSALIDSDSEPEEANAENDDMDATELFVSNQLLNFQISHSC